ncbi:MAG: hypothetical protein A2X18_06080 [Bacteroidetes bacterium GWF2_40_14]|nr:MAG: hypothetical protein A2X18_06080 [Bacteroidetes bacterium GWF2_40_14]
MISDITTPSTDSSNPLSETDKQTLLDIARESIHSAVLGGKKFKVTPDEYSDILKTTCGAFVTLHNKGKLRGCLGRMTGDLPLYKMIQEMAISASLYDYRFTPIGPDELSKIDIEISVLSPMTRIDDITEIELGKHGIFIQKGVDSGVFLPQVATETGWSREDFLGHCSRDKAGLGWTGWKSADVYIFTATILTSGD